jgi:hypothetical protein
MTDNLVTGGQPAGKNPYEHLRRTPRFKASDSKEMTVILERAPGCEPRQVRGTILDLSLGGAKLSVPAEVSLQEKVNVRWTVDDVDPNFTVGATVCWARTAGRNSWRLGCSFEKQLPQSFISELAVHGYIDRRQSGREPVTVAVTLQWEMTQQTVPVRVQDLSVGGLCILSDEFAPTDSRCRLIFGTSEGETETVAARVEWQRKTATGYILGCAYLDENAHQIVEKTIGGHFAAEGRSASLLGPPTDSKPPGSLGNVFADLIQRDQSSSLRQLARRSQLTLVAGILALGAAMVLSQFASTAGLLGWGGALAATLAAAACAMSYHRLTRQVTSLAAEQNGQQS